MIHADLGICWVLLGVCQRHEDHLPPEGLERGSIDACKTSEEVCAAFPGEAPYPISDASTATPMRTELVLGSGVLEGECGYRPTNRGGYVGNPLMWTLQRRHISLGFCLCGPI